MGILQEYKFFLIIAIIALVGIIALFFNTQKSQEYTDFSTSTQSSYAQIKSTAGDDKTIKDVYTVNGTDVKGLTNNSLFGLNLDGTANDIFIYDEFNGISFPGIEPILSTGKFKISLATSSSFPEGASGINNSFQLNSVTPSNSPIAKGWDLSENGYVIYTFENDTIAKNVINDYLQDGTLIGKSVFTQFTKRKNNSFASGSAPYTDESLFTFAGGEITDSTATGLVNIPQTIGGVTVTSIGAYAFNGNGITSVTIPSTVMSIGMNAFYGNLLTSVTIPEGVASIGQGAFHSNSLTSINIPDSVSTLGKWAFFGNDITSVTFGNGITSIPQGIFEGNAITSVTIPNNVTSIGQNAFYNNQLASVNLGNSVVTIGPYAFAYNNITSISFPSTLVNINWAAFQYNKITTVNLPSSVTTLQNMAFSNNGPSKNSGNVGSFVSGTNQTWNLSGTTWIKS